MLELAIKAGADNNVTTNLALVDNTNGSPAIDLTETDFDIIYIRERADAVKADATALTNDDDAHADNKIKEIDDAADHEIGVYRVDWPDAAFATGVDFVTLVLKHANIRPVAINVQLLSVPAEVITNNDKTGYTLTNLTDDSAGKLDDILDGTGGTGIKVSTIEVTSTTTLTGNVSLGGTLGVTGTTTFTGAVALPAGLTTDITGSISSCAAATVAAIDDINFSATMLASLNTACDTVTVTAIGDNVITAASTHSDYIAEINATVDTALTDIGLDHIFSASIAGTDVTDNSFAAKLVSKQTTADWDDYHPTTDSLQAIRDRGDTSWITSSVQNAGAGAITFTYTLTSSVDGTPIADADIWVTSDEAGKVVVASGRTDQNGQVTMYLDAGNSYFWRQKTGWNFSNPDLEVVA